MVSKISIAWSSLPSEYWHGLKIAVFDSYRPEWQDMRGRSKMCTRRQFAATHADRSESGGPLTRLARCTPGYDPNLTALLTIRSDVSSVRPFPEPIAIEDCDCAPPMTDEPFPLKGLQSYRDARPAHSKHE